MSLSRAGAILQVRTQMKTVSDNLSEDELDLAVDRASSELGWSYPISGNEKEYWVVERAKRHALYMLLFEAADDFQYKKIHLEHRFKNFHMLLERMDSDFEKALEDNPTLFSGVDTYKMFGTQIHAGFSYDSVGNDKTYDDDNEVDFFPKEG